MNKIVTVLILITSVLTSCDDGDFVVTSFDFSNESLRSCETGQGYVFYKVNSNSFESISVSIDVQATIFEQTNTTEYALNENSNVVHYRKYDGELPVNYFCATVPPTTPNVTTEFVGNQGVAQFTVTATRDDQDGIEESTDNQIDTDEDGLPDYYDFDDDGDNVPTQIELGADYLAGNTTQPLDSDQDGIPDYLDADDDNDGILTRYEDANGDLDPSNDITNGETNYLNPEVSNTNAIDLYREHAYLLSSDIQLQINNLILVNGEDEIIKETFVMGTIEDFINREERITPEF